MDSDYILTFSIIILGIFTVILQVISFLLLAGTVGYMTISGFWGGLAMILAAMSAQKKHFLKSQVLAIVAVIAGTVMIGPHYWSFENNFPHYNYDCAQYWKGFSSMCRHIGSNWFVSSLAVSLQMLVFMIKRLVHSGETKIAVEVFFFVFGILTISLNAILIIKTTKKQQ